MRMKSEQHGEICVITFEEDVPGAASLTTQEMVECWQWVKRNPLGLELDEPEDTFFTTIA